MRLDKALAERGLCRSRTEAQTLIGSAQITVNGHLAHKASLDVGEDAVLARLDTGPRYVSRGAFKLEAALIQFGIAVKGRHALDVGASTGGFTDVLLRREIASVIAIDVGEGQMAPEIASDPRVQSREKINARAIVPTDFPHLFQLIVADLSFISLTLVLPALAPLLTDDGDIVCLVKPQFEVGRQRLGKDGIVRDPKSRDEALARVAAAAGALGLVEMGRVTSPIEGSDGNIEFLLHLKPTPNPLPRGEGANLSECSPSLLRGGVPQKACRNHVIQRRITPHDRIRAA